MNTRILTALTAVSVAGIASAGAGDITDFTAVINGLQEVPANGSPTTGTLTGSYNSGTNSFSFSWDLTDNLIGDPSSPGAHIHNAPAGSNGPVLFGFNNPDGTWPLSGSAMWTGLSTSQVDDLFAGNMYINFHTTEFAGGEVRGQIFVVPTPGSAGILAGAALLGLRRRRTN